MTAPVLVLGGEAPKSGGGTAKKGSRARRAGKERLLFGLLGIATVLGVWQLLVEVGSLDIFLFSSPWQVIQTFASEIHHGTIWRDLWVTFQEWGIGFGVATAVGVPLGMVAGLVRPIRLVAEPWLNVLSAMPELALIPIFIIWFGIGLGFKVWVAFTGAIFVIAVNTIAGVHGSEQKYLAVAKTFGASNWTTVRTVVLPGSVPYVMTGLRQGSGRALIGVVAGEFIAANQGLGYYINSSGQVLDTPLVMVGIVIICAYGILMGEVIRVIEGRFDAWRRTE